MNKFPLFKSAFDLTDIGKFVSTEVDKFTKETKGKNIVETLAHLPEFIGHEISGNKDFKNKMTPDEERKYISAIESEVKKKTDKGKTVTITRMQTVESGTSEATNFYREILSRLGLPQTSENLLFMEAWRKAEGGKASFNPFNTTMKAPGATNYNSVGVKNYLSKEQGIDATVRTLQKGYYTEIIAALRRGDDATACASALAKSPWGTGALAQKILNNRGFSPTSIHYLPEDVGESKDTALV